jgi:hypothetical protein
MATIPIRGQGITTRPLYMILQPTHPCSRYLWINKPTYVPPNYIGPASTMASKGKPVSRGVYRAPLRRS